MKTDIYYILGADPGKHGAIVLLPFDITGMRLDLKLVQIPFTKDGEGDVDIVALEEELSKYAGAIAGVFKEHVHAVAGNSATSMFTFGEANGMLKAVLKRLVSASELCSKVFEVSPATWQALAWKGVDKVKAEAMVDRKTGLIKRDKAGNMMFKVDTKQTSAAAAHKLFPEESFIPKKCRVEHDGVIDAALIAYYGFKTITG